MNNEINLLIPEKHNPTILKRIKLLRMISLSFLYLIVLSAVSVFFLILTSPLPNLRSQENAASAKLAQLRSTSGKLFLLRDRLNRVTKILDQRPEFSFILTRIEEQLPNDVSIEQLKTDSKSLSVTVISPSLLPITTFVNNMNNLATSEAFFSRITLSNLSYSEDDALYRVTISGRL